MKSILLLTLVTIASTVNAATLVSYNFGTAATPTNSGNTLAGITATDFIGSEVNGGGTRATFSSGGGNSYGHSSATVGTIAGTPAGDLTVEVSGTTDSSLTVTGGNADINGTTVGALADALTAESYFEFSVDAGADSIDLQSLSFLNSRNHNTRAVDRFSLFVSTDNFAVAPIEANALTIVNGTTTGTFNEFSFDLSSFANTDEELTFRIYLSGKTASSNINAASSFDNFVLTGDVITVPEPSTYALLSVAAFFMVVRRRRYA